MKVDNLRMDMINLYRADRAGGQDHDTIIEEPLEELLKYFSKIDTLDISRPWRATGHSEDEAGLITSSHQHANLPRIRTLRI